MKIHLGSGSKYREGWVNVDLYAERADVREDLRTVAFPSGSATEAEMIHVIEHFERAEALTICAHVFDWLAPGASFLIETPNRIQCRKLCLMNHFKKQINGSKGILGGRHGDKQKWHDFLIAHRFLIAERSANGVPPNEIVPEEYRQPGAAHLFVWSPEELASELERIGFKATIGNATAHGHRFGRDFRVTGTKP